MRKSEWIEEHEKEMENYGKSILSSSEDPDPIKEYEHSIFSHYTEDYDYLEEYESGIKHFQD